MKLGTVAAADGVRCARVRWEINFLLTSETAPFFCVYPVFYVKSAKVTNTSALLSKGLQSQIWSITPPQVWNLLIRLFYGQRNRNFIYFSTSPISATVFQFYQIRNWTIIHRLVYYPYDLKLNFFTSDVNSITRISQLTDSLIDINRTIFFSIVRTLFFLVFGCGSPLTILHHKAKLEYPNITETGASNCLPASRYGLA